MKWKSIRVLSDAFFVGEFVIVFKFPNRKTTLCLVRIQLNLCKIYFILQKKEREESCSIFPQKHFGYLLHGRSFGFHWLLSFM